MACTLGGFSSPSTWIASTTHKPTPSPPKPLLASFPTAAASHSAYSDGGRLALSHTPSRKWSLMAATASDSLVAEEEEEEASEPEPVEAQIASVVASEAPKGEEVFAVVMIGSRQYIVIPGRFIYTQRLKGASVNDKIILSKVLLVSTKTNAYIGQPVVQNAVVHAVVEDQGLDDKVIVFKYKKKKHYRRNIGHRQPNTRLRITGIAGYQDAPADALPV